MDKAAHAGRGSGARQGGGGFGLVDGGGAADRTVGAAGEVDHGLDADRDEPASRPRADVADRAQDSRRAIGSAPPRRDAEQPLAPRRANSRHSARPIKPAAPVTRMRASSRPPGVSLAGPPPICASEAAVIALERVAPRGKTGRGRSVTLSRERRVALDDTIRPYSELPARARPGAAAEAAVSRHRGLVFLLAPPAGRAGGARRRVRGHGRDAGAGAWRADRRRRLCASPAAVAAARRRARRRGPGDCCDHPALPASNAPTSCTTSR